LAVVYLGAAFVDNDVTMNCSTSQTVCLPPIPDFEIDPLMAQGIAVSIRHILGAMQPG
jgi:hypothetical protein